MNLRQPETDLSKILEALWDMGLDASVKIPDEKRFKNEHGVWNRYELLVKIRG